MTISHGSQTAVVVEVGGGLRSYDVDGVHVLDGYPETEMCGGGRGQVLAPWPNRLAGGRYSFGGREHQLALSEPARGNAIHGLCRWLRWEVVVHHVDRCQVRCLLAAQPGYPFTLRVDVDYLLDDAGLSVTTSALNLGGEPAPFGVGFHPYLSLGEDAVDSLRLEIPAAVTLVTDDRAIPTGERLAVDGTESDFRTARQVGATRLDTCFGDLARDPAGHAVIRVAGARRSASLWLDEHHPYLMVFTGDTLEPAARRRGLALEPMTCAPNAFVSGDGIVVLKPGVVRALRWGIGIA